MLQSVGRMLAPCRQRENAGDLMSLDGVYDEANPFARILRGEAPAAKVYEDGDVLAFMDLFPQSTGHVLVIPKTSTARNILEVDAATLVTLTLAVQKVAKAARRALQPDGIIVVQFNGQPAGQTVYHLHFHVIPCWTGRPLKGHGHGQMAEAEELCRLAAKIAAALED
jgi:histidine triad (HIT) family protein